MVSRRLLVILICALGVAPVTSAGAARYRPSVVRNSMTFPVARTAWYSVINFSNDWHAPRLRLEDGRWRLVGFHEGTDVFAEPGTPVRSAAAGRVEAVGWTFYSGWRVGIRSSDGRYWLYAHLREFAPGISPGALVEAGTRIGEVGNTGYGNRPGHDDEFTYHLHFGIQESDGTWVNPYPLLRRLYETAVSG